MFLLYLAGSLLLFAWPILAQFNMYPSVSPTILAASLNISSNCLTALNATVDCDQDLFQMAGNADGYFWSDDNATALCTSQCLSSASSWWSQSANACENDQLNAYGRVSVVHISPISTQLMLSPSFIQPRRYQADFWMASISFA